MIDNRNMMFNTVWLGLVALMILWMSAGADVKAQDDNSVLPTLSDPSLADELISVNFDKVDIRTMLKTIGDITGINFVIDDAVSGTVTVMSPSQIRLGEVYSVLETVLDIKGYAAVPVGNVIKIVPKSKASQQNLNVAVGKDPTTIPQTDSVITQIIPLSYADAREISEMVKPLLAGGSHMAIYPRTNSLLITDTAANIHHIAKIIQKVDVVGSQQEISVIHLDYASAQVLSEQITQIMSNANGLIVSDSGVPAMSIIADVRTNALIIQANPAELSRIRNLITQLDVERPKRTNNVHVVYLKNAPAKETAESLNQALTNLKITGALEASQNVNVTADVGTNALIVTALEQDFEVISGIVEKLDIIREQVMVEMLIVEVSEDDLTEIGIDWSTIDDAVADSIRAFGSTNFGPRVDFIGGDTEGLAVGAWRKTSSGTQIGALLHALNKKSGVNILSTPQILTSNHQTAKIIVGENIPFVTDSRITETDPSTPTVIKRFEYKDVGIELEITPHVSQAGMIRLEVNNKFTKLIESTTGNEDTPTTAKRQAETVVTMQSGATVVIGGLIRDDKVTTQKKVPLVGDLPLLGGLFRYNKDRIQKTNLLIFITPEIMADQQALISMTERKKKIFQPEIAEFWLQHTRSGSNQEVVSD